MSFIFWLSGLVVGAAAANLLARLRKTSGVLKIDLTNPDKDLYRFEIDDLDILHQKKRIELKIVHENNMPQK